MNPINQLGLISALAVTAIAGTALSVHGAVISVDFQRPSSTAGTVSGDVTGSFVTGTSSTWNTFELLLNGSLGSDSTSAALISRDGSPTDNDVKITLKAGPQFDAPETQAKFDTRFQNGGAGALHGDGFVSQWNNTNATLEITGLLPNTSYDINFFTMYKTNAGDPGTNGAWVTMPGHTDVGVGFESNNVFNGVTSDGTGLVSINWDDNGTIRDESIAALEIQGNFAIPEPSAAALLGVAGLGLMIRRRRK